MAVFLHFTAKTARRKQEIAEASGPSSLFAMGRRFWLSRLPGSRRVASLRLGLVSAADGRPPSLSLRSIRAAHNGSGA